MRPLMAWLLKAAITAGLLTWLFSRPEVRSGLAGLTQLTPGWLVVGFLTAGLAQAFAAWRWRVCLRTAGVGLPYLSVLRITLISTGAGYLSIGTLGEDAVRLTLAAQRCPGQRAALLASVGLDHSSAFPAVVLLWLSVIVAAGGILTVGQGVWIALGTGLAAFFGVGLALRRFQPDWHRRLRGFLLEAGTRRGFAMAALLSLPLTLLHYAVFFCAARALGVMVPVVKFCGAAAVADAAASLPISVAGLGVREKAFETILGGWHGVPAGQAVALSLAGLGLILLWGLAGAVCLLVEPVGRSAGI